MTEYLTPDELIADDAGDDEIGIDVELPSGGRIRVRGLSRAEHLWIGKGTDDAAEIEARMLSKAMMQPTMSEAQIKAWQKKRGATKDLDTAGSAVRALSGFGEGAGKSRVDQAGD